MTPQETDSNLVGSHIDSLSLSRLTSNAGSNAQDNRPAGLLTTSLPWPQTQVLPLALNGLPTHCQPLGQWPDSPPGTPRRLLLTAQNKIDGAPPAALNLSTPSANGAVLPSATAEVFARSPLQHFIWERHFLRIEFGGRAVGIAMGLRTGDEVHWWEACRLVEVDRSAQCLTIEMGGAIPHRLMDDETFRSHPGLSNPFLHKHNWVNGHIFMRLHANGVCEVFARHTNSKFFDDGLTLEDVVPVVGFRLLDDKAASGASTLVQKTKGVWDGSQSTLSVGDAELDLEEAARLATPSAPGSLECRDDFLVWQPYEGFELFGGTCPEQLIGDEYILRRERHSMLRGMSRTLRFSLSLSDSSPRVERYIAPAWWYGVCREFSPAPYLPVSNSYDRVLSLAREWVQFANVEGGFEDGALPRMARRTDESNDRINSDDTGRLEPSWEGELPFSVFQIAWRTGNGDDYNAAMRSAYHFTDLAIDHANKVVRMHGYPPPAVALPMARLQAPIAAYLETGDPFLKETAEIVTLNSYGIHKNSWPRMAVGRDACFIRSAVLLYRYFGYEYFRHIAYEGIKTVSEAQREDGSFGDQGGGTGLHQWGAYITKPWMAMLATGGVLDYLELFPDDELCLNVVRKTADWLMSERYERDGSVGWGYQHFFNGTRTHYNPSQNETKTLPSGTWHQENIGRLMLFCAQTFDKPEYVDAWAQSHAGGWARNQARRKAKLRGNMRGAGDHGVSATLQFIPWIQDHLWRATLQNNEVDLQPYTFGELTPKDAKIQTPDGVLSVPK